MIVATRDVRAGKKILSERQYPWQISTPEAWPFRQRFLNPLGGGVRKAAFRAAKQEGVSVCHRRLRLPVRLRHRIQSGDRHTPPSQQRASLKGSFGCDPPFPIFCKATRLVGTTLGSCRIQLLLQCQIVNFELIKRDPDGPEPLR